ncbi:putative permease [Corynebacterium mustelae]|uniref:Probable membrane transporter protein n=1 Tax=Corynebacterium mustelae TaxID=571915 RepID=A0A0G3H0X0_9CORY|nr:sulfite exporter TauE/SafE family protein [Corynebacterium mustelae]AKK07064.1 putative permease [Corynebacterium mustelae]
MLIVIAGAIAQLVDGGLGMGFGVTSTTILLLSMTPAHASAVVHAAEVGTTLASGLAHWRFGNVNWRIVFRLGLPGAVGAGVGATVLSHISANAAQPITAIILALVGANLLWRFSRGRIRKPSSRQYSTPMIVALGTVGGLVDATGGGGWGPMTTSTLLALGKDEPRRVIGTVNTAEFLVATAATIGFVIGLWDQLDTHLFAIGQLMLGGVIAAPVAAWLVTKVNPIILGGFVGTALIALNLPVLWPVAVVAGIILTRRGIKRSRRTHIIVSTQPRIENQYAEVKAL